MTTNTRDMPNADRAYTPQLGDVVTISRGRIRHRVVAVHDRDVDLARERENQPNEGGGHVDRVSTARLRLRESATIPEAKVGGDGLDIVMPATLEESHDALRSLFEAVQKWQANAQSWQAVHDQQVAARLEDLKAYRRELTHPTTDPEARAAQLAAADAAIVALVVAAPGA